jgi:hypothetical protein
MQQIIQQTTPKTYRFRFTDTDGTEQGLCIQSYNPSKKVTQHYQRKIEQSGCILISITLLQETSHVPENQRESLRNTHRGTTSPRQ